MAARDGNVGEVERILRTLRPGGVNVRIGPGSGWHTGKTALQLACIKPHLPVVWALVAAGASADGGTGRPHPLLVAAQAGAEDVVDAMLRAGADRTVRTELGLNALHMAARSGRTGVVGVLLDRGFDVNERTGPGSADTAAGIAAAAYMVSTLELLAARGASMRDDDRHLVAASEEGHARMARMLMRMGASATGSGGRGDPPCFRAAYRGRAEVLQAMLEEGGLDPNAIHPTDGNTLLGGACLGCHREAIQTLLRAGADANLPFGEATPNLPLVAVAAAAGKTVAVRMQCIEDLVAAGASVNVANDAGLSPLAALISTGAGAVTVAKMLSMGALADGPPVATAASLPLVLAVALPDVPMALALIRAGGDVRRTDGYGLTALEVAKSLAQRGALPPALQPALYNAARRHGATAADHWQALWSVVLEAGWTRRRAAVVSCVVAEWEY